MNVKQRTHSLFYSYKLQIYNLHRFSFGFILYIVKLQSREGIFHWCGVLVLLGDAAFRRGYLKKKRKKKPLGFIGESRMFLEWWCFVPWFVGWLVEATWDMNFGCVSKRSRVRRGVAVRLGEATKPRHGKQASNLAKCVCVSVCVKGRRSGGRRGEVKGPGVRFCTAGRRRPDDVHDDDEDTGCVCVRVQAAGVHSHPMNMRPDSTALHSS